MTIDGFRLKVTSEELRKHCVDRATYHLSRAEIKDAEIPKLREAMEAVAAATRGQPTKLAHMSKSSATYNLDPDDAVDNLEKDIRDHRNKAEVFKFYADHLFDGDYNLDENALRRLEIIR